ncbi:putative dipeptidyl-aminopeptidase B [Lachnellula hyalina]|uniref:dipeptidyl-peptidase IV n=1 Tax=Lachnellula hyalina TaxID=1316788 RepID=A0A8H8R573_9HELO|nr:putative dipeptidyl-aminopeptidase B [Lachnellula hyalina]TVY27720.1 putative dipeptidyl-aminopeptidase B [Lachnellula hyalina]
MAGHEEEGAQLLPLEGQKRDRKSEESIFSASTTSLVFERIGERADSGNGYSVNGDSKTVTPKFSPRGDSVAYADDENMRHPYEEEKEEDDLESGPFINTGVNKTIDKKFRKLMWIIGGCFIGAWLLALVVFLGQQAYRHPSESPHDPAATSVRGHGKKVTLDQVQSGQWRATKHDISWIQGANGEDGLLLEQNVGGKDYLIVEDIRGTTGDDNKALATKTLMTRGYFEYKGKGYNPSKVFPSKDLKKVLIATDVQSNWRHSFYAKYFIFDVEKQTAEALDPANINGRVQLASWSPQSDAIVFTRDNNLFLRKLNSDSVIQITKDGGPNFFYGAPDWVYEEEVFGTNSATWWAEDGKYVAFLRTNESEVPEYPIEYFVSHPSGVRPEPGEENYPEVRQIKYPKAGAPNPTVDLQFYDVGKGDVFEVKIADSFAPDDLLITEVVWAGSTGKALIRESNRESDVLRVVLVDVELRTGKTVRTQDVQKLDGGWFEVSQKTRYVPADPANGRPQDGYIDTVIHDNYDHLGYFTPLDNPTPIMLTSGNWEVVDAPSAVDLKKNLVYFVSTKASSIQRQVYSVKLDGTNLQALTDETKEGYYGASFSSGAGYALVNYDGPNIPWQKVVSTPSNSDHYEKVIEENPVLADLAKTHELPIKIFSTVNVDGFELNVVERRPPHFSEKKKYPVLFFLYGGPGSQSVSKGWSVDFQAYIASSLGYIVVTVDGRGTGFIGRKARTIIRGNIGYYEAYDQIETAKIWAAKKYVDASRMAIWGWSYGGFMTLKTLEQDAGQTFSYGMAVAPVTDWRFYDSIYTERYMHTPQHNPDGYDNSSISNATAIGQNVRFLVMHGVADDNVHMQNTLTLLDKLDLAGVENYDVHVFPDSDHSIYFHNANRIVYDKLSNWLINAFNGEWLRTSNAVPLQIDAASE